MDMGYDIADYKTIDPRYGSNEDVYNLITELKKRDMKLMMDLVVNHTSSDHDWFKESRSSKSNPKRDWYIWKPPRYDEAGNPQPPNNWSMILGEANSAWTYDETTKEYYLSIFCSGQPDLNWENPDVRDAVHDVMHFWLEKGVCGFRMDVINLISKVQSFPDAPPILGPEFKYHPGLKFYTNGPRLHEFLKEMHEKVLSKYDVTTVGEMPGVSDIDEVIRVVNPDQKELHMIFIFDLVDIDNIPGSVRMTWHEWKLKDFKTITSKWQRAMIEKNGWNSVFLENHDNPRSVSRYTDDSPAQRVNGAKMLAILQTTLSGTLFVYQGEELGMVNFPAAWDPAEYMDIEAIEFWKKTTSLYSENPEKLALGKHILARKARDHARTPVQWTNAPNAGFCPPDVKPWMRANDDYPVCNAEAQVPDESSVWAFWKKQLQFRKEHKNVFVYGDYEEVDAENEKVFAYVRTGTDGSKWLVVLNWCGEDNAWTVPGKLKVGEWVVDSYGEKSAVSKGDQSVKLGPWQGVLGKCV